MARDVTVLVVEDDEAMQRVLQQTLRPRYTVLTASSLAEAAWSLSPRAWSRSVSSFFFIARRTARGVWPASP